MQLLEFIESIFYIAIRYGVLLLECIGAVVLMMTAIKSLIRYFKHNSDVRLTLAQGIALALEFKMGGEVLRTVVVRDWAELGILGAIILLRSALTMILHWEIKNEKAHGDL